MSTAGFVHLHGHSEYSLLDGGCHVKKMAERAAEHGMPALALTDHGNLFGAIQHYNACKDAGIKPIIGCEAYVAVESRHLRQAGHGNPSGSHHLVLLAKNATGYKNLTKMISLGYTEGYYYNPRVDKELLRQYGEGLICMSACIGGEIPYMIEREGMPAAEATAREFLDIFGDDYYLEIQRHDIDREGKINDGLVKLHQKLDIPLAATNDFHFLNADDHKAHDALLCIQTGKTVATENRLCYPDGLYMKSPEEMYALFPDMAHALETTLAIAEKCELDLEFGEMKLPNFPIPEGFANDADYLVHLANEGLKHRYERFDDEIRQRLDYELDLITKMNFSGYFLIVWDCIHFARQNGITVGPGRGSAAGSLVAYCLNITDTDPIKHGLLFERFLNPERISMPDIDIDFADTGRDRLIRYVTEKYGERNVSQVITFGTMGAKAVIRDVGRVLDVPFAEVDRIAKLVPNELKISLDDAIGKVPELKQMANATDEKGQLVEYARKLEGLARHASVHACAIIIAPSDITDFVPLYRAPKDGRITTQFDGPTCEEMGLLKMDFLGLKELSLMDEAVRLIQLHTPDFDLDRIPWDDRLTFELFSRGDTVGVFQFESAGMREYLEQLKPDKLEDIIAMNALYRPGPMQRIPTFIDRKHGREAVVYDHPTLEPILEPTYGVITYQEQVQRICRDLSGFTLGQADGIRKAMGKKLADVMEKYKKEFIDGAAQHGADKDIARRIWSDIEVFSGYGFNKSHAACYSEIAYKNAYLKANFPKDYMSASLTNDMGNTDRLTVLLDECQRMEMPILAPDVNESSLNFTPTPEGIRFGLGAIKNVGSGAAQAVIDSRLAGERFATLFEFCERLDLRAVNRRVVESLIAAGALDSLEGHRAQMMEGLDISLKSAQNAQDERERGQISLFDLGDEAKPGAEFEQRTLPEIAEWAEMDQLGRERELLGFFVSGHPLSRYRRDLLTFATPLDQLEDQSVGSQLRVGGLISRISALTDRRGQPFAFVTLEDTSGKGDVAFFSEAYATHRELLEQDQIILVEGRLTERNGRLSIQADKAFPLSEARSKLTRSVNLLLPYAEVESGILQNLRQVCERYTGTCDLVLHLQNGGSKDAVVRSRTLRVSPCDDLLREVDALIGPKRAWLDTERQATTIAVPEERWQRKRA